MMEQWISYILYTWYLLKIKVLVLLKYWMSDIMITWYLFENWGVENVGTINILRIVHLISFENWGVGIIETEYLTYCTLDIFLKLRCWCFWNIECLLLWILDIFLKIEVLKMMKQWISYVLDTWYLFKIGCWYFWNIECL